MTGFIFHKVHSSWWRRKGKWEDSRGVEEKERGGDQNTWNSCGERLDICDRCFEKVLPRVFQSGRCKIWERDSRMEEFCISILEFCACKLSIWFLSASTCVEVWIMVCFISAISACCSLLSLFIVSSLSWIALRIILSSARSFPCHVASSFCESWSTGIKWWR